MPGVEFIQVNGKKILYEDYSGCTPKELSTCLQKAKVMISREPLQSVIALVNVIGVHFNSESVNAMEEFVKENTPYIKQSVIVGLTGVKKIIFQTITNFTGRNNFIVFDDLDDAKNFLSE